MKKVAEKFGYIKKNQYLCSGNKQFYLVGLYAYLFI